MPGTGRVRAGPAQPRQLTSARPFAPRTPTSLRAIAAAVKSATFLRGRRQGERTIMSTTFVSHLECSLTGRRYEAGRVHGLSEAGRPLLVRYDLAAMAKALSKEQLARSAEPGFWRYAAMLPVTRPENRVSLGEVMTPLIRSTVRPPALARSPGGRWSRTKGACRPGRSRPRDGRRGGDGQGIRDQALAIPTDGNAGAALAAYARRAGRKANGVRARPTRR